MSNYHNGPPFDFKRGVFFEAPLLHGYKMSIAARIKTKLTEALQPEVLDIEDESHKHAGHNPDAANGETHFKLKVVSDAFLGKSRIERHRMVFALLKAEQEEKIHALTLGLFTPEEAKKIK
jgi:BolA protein